MMLCQTNYSEERELEILNMLKMKKLDGVIICSRANSKEKLEEYTKFGPIVMCEEIDSKCISSVHIDYYKVFSLGMKSLIDAGHTHIGYCIGRSNSVNSQRRKKAYEDSLQQSIVTPLETWKFEGCFTVEDGRNVIREWAHMSVKPTAFLVSCNHIAAGMVTEAKKQGIRIPEDITIIGCDDQEVADILGITTISHSSKNVGVKAFELLYEKINEEKLDVKHIELLPELVNRETT